MDSDLTFLVQHAQDLVNENATLKLQVESLYNELSVQKARIVELEKWNEECAKMQAKQPEQLKIDGTPYSLSYVNALKSKLQEFAQANQEFYVFTETQKKKYNEQLCFLKHKNDLLRKENNDITERLQVRGVGLVSENKIMQTDGPALSTKLVQTQNTQSDGSQNVGMNTDITALQVEEYVFFKETFVKHFDMSRISEQQLTTIDSAAKRNAYQQVNDQLLSQFQQNTSRQQTPTVNEGTIGTFANMFVSQKSDEQPAAAASTSTNVKDDSIYEMQLHISKKPSTYLNTQVADDNIEIIDTLQANDSNLPSMDRNQLQHVSVARSNIQAYLELQNNITGQQPINVSETQQTVQHCSSDNFQITPGSVKHQSPKNSMTNRLPNGSQLHVVGSLQSSILEPPNSRSKSPPNSNSKRVSVQFQQGVTLLTEKQPLLKIKIERNNHAENKFQIPLFQHSLQQLSKSHGLQNKPKGNNSRSVLSIDEAMPLGSAHNSLNQLSGQSRHHSLMEVQTEQKEHKELSKNIRKKRAKKPGEVQKLIMPAVREKEKSPSIMNSFASQPNEDGSAKPQSLEGNAGKSVTENKSLEDLQLINSVAQTVVQLNENLDEDKREGSHPIILDQDNDVALQELQNSPILGTKQAKSQDTDLIDQVLDQDVNLDAAFEGPAPQSTQPEPTNEPKIAQQAELQVQSSGEPKPLIKEDITAENITKLNSVEKVEATPQKETESAAKDVANIDETQTMSPEVIDLRAEQDDSLNLKNFSVEHETSLKEAQNDQSNAITVPEEENPINTSKEEEKLEKNPENLQTENVLEHPDQQQQAQEEVKPEQDLDNQDVQDQKPEEVVQEEKEEPAGAETSQNDTQDALDEKNVQENPETLQDPAPKIKNADGSALQPESPQKSLEIFENQPKLDQIIEPSTRDETGTENHSVRSALGQSAPLVDLDGVPQHHESATGEQNVIEEPENAEVSVDYAPPAQETPVAAVAETAPEDPKVAPALETVVDGILSHENVFATQEPQEAAKSSEKSKSNADNMEKDQKVEEHQNCADEPVKVETAPRALEAAAASAAVEAQASPVEALAEVAAPETLNDNLKEADGQKHLENLESQPDTQNDPPPANDEVKKEATPEPQKASENAILDDFGLDGEQKQPIQLIEQPAAVESDTSEPQSAQNHQQLNQTDDVEIPESLQHIDELQNTNYVVKRQKKAEKNEIDVFDTANEPLENHSTQSVQQAPTSAPKKKKKKVRKDTNNNGEQLPRELNENDALLDMLMPQLEKDLLG